MDALETVRKLIQIENRLDRLESYEAPLRAASATSATTGTMTVTMSAGIRTITPTGACTFNASGGAVGSVCTFVITTSGITPYNLTWNTGYKSQGVLSTGGVTAMKFTVTFVFDGANWCEVARTTAM